MVRRILRYAERRLVKVRSIEGLVWAIEAIETVYLLRRRTHPEVPNRSDRNRHTMVEAAVVVLFEGFTEPSPSTHR